MLKIGKDVEEGDLLDDIVTEMALGIDLTLRDIQAQLKKERASVASCKRVP